MTGTAAARTGRHARATGRRSWALLSLATALGIWWGVSAPDTSPVTPPAGGVPAVSDVAEIPVVPGAGTGGLDR
jgi:hypothetical protein